MRRLKSSFILATTAVILAACGGDGATNTASEGAEGQVVNYTAPTELATLDTTLMTDINSSNYISHAIEGLLKINADGKPVPAIAAEAGTVSEDGLTYTYKLRDDAVWSNGEPVTANDFVFAWQRLVIRKRAHPTLTWLRPSRTPLKSWSEKWTLQSWA